MLIAKSPARAAATSAAEGRTDGSWTRSHILISFQPYIPTCQVSPRSPDNQEPSHGNGVHCSNSQVTILSSGQNGPGISPRLPRQHLHGHVVPMEEYASWMPPAGLCLRVDECPDSLQHQRRRSWPMLRMILSANRLSYLFRYPSSFFPSTRRKRIFSTPFSRWRLK